MGLFSSSPREILIAAFDITSSSIGGILFSHHRDKLPEIIATSRFSTDFFPDVEFKKFEHSLHKTFERSIAHIKKFLPRGVKKPDLIIIVFSSPYYVSQSKIAHHIQPSPFNVTKEFIKEIFEEEAVVFKKEWQSQHSTEEKSGHGVELIESESMGYKLNGYPINQPLGKKVRNFESCVYLSLGIKAIQDKLKECVSHSFGETPVRFQTFPFVAFKALKGIIDISKGLLLVNIGGEITDLVLIKNNILEETISFPFGENFLVRRIASVFSFSLEESFSLLSQYTGGELHSETNEKIRKIIEDAGKKWCELFNNAMLELPSFSFIPQNRLIIGGRAALALKDFIICTKEQPLTIDFFLPEAFKNHFIFRKGFKEDKDILLMLSAIFTDKIFLEK